MSDRQWGPLFTSQPFSQVKIHLFCRLVGNASTATEGGSLAGSRRLVRPRVGVVDCGTVRERQRTRFARYGHTFGAQVVHRLRQRVRRAPADMVDGETRGGPEGSRESVRPEIPTEAETVGRFVKFALNDILRTSIVEPEHCVVQVQA